MKSLCIGHANYDISLPVNSFPKENEKYDLKEKMESSGGGACNVSYLLGKWKNEVYFSGVVGYDELGNFIKKDLESIGVKTEFLETSYEKKTTSSFIIINKETHSRTVFNIEPIEFHLKKYEYDINPDTIYMDGYEYSASMAAINKFANAITILDASIPSKEILTLGRTVKYLICSLEFAETVSGRKADFNNPVSLLGIYKLLKDRFPNNEIIITLKNYGALYCLNNEVKVMPTIVVTEVDRSGAGDIFRGAFTYAIGKKYDLETCVRISNIAAGLSTTKYGAKLSIPLLSEVMSYYEQKFGPIKSSLEEQTENPTETNEPTPSITPTDSTPLV